MIPSASSFLSWPSTSHITCHTPLPLPASASSFSSAPIATTPVNSHAKRHGLQNRWRARAYWTQTKDNHDGLTERPAIFNRNAPESATTHPEFLQRPSKNYSRHRVRSGKGGAGRQKAPRRCRHWRHIHRKCTQSQRNSTAQLAEDEIAACQHAYVKTRCRSRRNNML